jgi:hypothetical protein
MTISKIIVTFISGILSILPPPLPSPKLVLSLPKDWGGLGGVTKKPPVVGRLVLLFCRCAYFALTAAIPTVYWSLRIRTEIITIRTRVIRMVCMADLRYFADYRLFRE